jgi:tRNA threonylcarbamoyladenosine biosynthesis protein TsaB
VGAEIVGVNTLEAIAAQAPAECETVWTLMDAHRGQLFVARYRRKGDGVPEAIIPAHIAGIEAWLETYSPGAYVTGPGIGRVQRMPPGALLVEESQRTPQASTVGQLAWRHFQSGRRADIWTFAPDYYRPSAAEEKHGA